MSTPPKYDASVSPGAATSAGAALLNERRRQGLSLGDVSRQLKLSVRQVEALERDDHSAYKGPLFIHGFIRNYAKLLGLDPEPLIRSTDSLLNPPGETGPAAPEPERAQPVRVPRKSFPRWPAVVAVLVIVIAGMFYLGGRRGPDADRSSPTIAQNDLPATPAKQSVEPRPGADKKNSAEARHSAPPTAKVAERPNAGSPASEDGSIASGPTTTAGAVAPGSSARVTVRMIFDDESWVEIKDRNGETIFGQLNAAGTRRSVSGEPPLSVVVGNAGGVQLFRGDKNIDLAPHTRMAVARLTLE